MKGLPREGEGQQEFSVLAPSLWEHGRSPTRNRTKLAGNGTGPWLEQRLSLLLYLRTTWPLGSRVLETTAPSMPWEPTWLPISPIPQDYSTWHASGCSFLLSDPAGTPSPRLDPTPPQAPWPATWGCPGSSPRALVEQGGGGGGERGRGAERGGVGWRSVRRGTGAGERDGGKKAGAGQGVEKGNPW